MTLRSLGLSFLRSERGVAAIEFAFAAPVLLLLSAGVYEFSSAYQDQSTVNKLASQYAIAWADCVDTPTGVCGSELSQYNTFYAVRNVMPQLTPTASYPLQVRMIDVTMSGTTANPNYGSSTKIYSATNAASTTVTSITTNAQLLAVENTNAAATLSNGQAGVIVTVIYTHQIGVLGPLLNNALATTITMQYTVVQMKSGST